MALVCVSSILTRRPIWIQNTIALVIVFFHDLEVKRKKERRFKGFNLFNKKEIEKATKHINDEMDEYAEGFYDNKREKEKDDGFEL